jgi:hypothetical protein
MGGGKALTLSLSRATGEGTLSQPCVRPPNRSRTGRSVPSPAARERDRVRVARVP